jgi:hypothetical protein
MSTLSKQKVPLSPGPPIGINLHSAHASNNSQESHAPVLFADVDDLILEHGDSPARCAVREPTITVECRNEMYFVSARFILQMDIDIPNQNTNRHFFFLDRIQLKCNRTNHTEYKPDDNGSGVTQVQLTRSTSQTWSASLGTTGPTPTVSVSASIVRNAGVTYDYSIASWELTTYLRKRMYSLINSLHDMLICRSSCMGVAIKSG